MPAVLSKGWDPARPEEPPPAPEPPLVLQRQVIQVPVPADPPQVLLQRQLERPVLLERQQLLFPAPGTKACTRCHSQNKWLKTCTGCFQARYCGHLCQLADWPRHKHECPAGIQNQKREPHPDDFIGTCNWCQVQRPRMKKCIGCHWARYCSRECARKDWPRHQPVCDPDHQLPVGDDYIQEPTAASSSSASSSSAQEQISSILSANQYGGSPAGQQIASLLEIVCQQTIQSGHRVRGVEVQFPSQASSSDQEVPNMPADQFASLLEQAYQQSRQSGHMVQVHSSLLGNIPSQASRGDQLFPDGTAALRMPQVQDQICRHSGGQLTPDMIDRMLGRHQRHPGAD